MRFVAKSYTLQQKCLKGQTCLLGTRWYNVGTPTLRAAMHSVTDRQTDERTDMMMPIADYTA